VVEISSVVLEKKSFKGKVYGQTMDDRRYIVIIDHLSLQQSTKWANICRL